MANKARLTSPMNIKASGANELCDNRVKTHHASRSDYFKTRSLVENTILFISKKVYKDLKVKKVR